MGEGKGVIGAEKLEGLYELAKDLGSGRISVSAYLKTLSGRFSDAEPMIKAFLPESSGRFERLQREAEALEARFPDATSRPPLFGVPLGVKDIFQVEGFPTRAGSRIPAEVLEGPEAQVVKDLKAAGVLILGKTVTTEFAYFVPGPTRNPHDLERTPGGSSSGSAAAVAAGLCPLALGSQTIGSVIRPAAFCGVIGFKPSYNRISLKGVIPLAPSVDHVGYFCRDVGGASVVASVLCKPWRHTATVSDPVFGAPEGPYLQKASRDARAHYQDAISRLSGAGLDVIPAEVMADFEEIALRHNQLIAAEAAAVHEAWFARFSDLYHPKTADLIKRGRDISHKVLQTCKDSRIRLRDVLQETMEKRRISAWLAPAAVGPAPRGLDSTGDPIMNLPWTHAGLPVVNLPMRNSREDMPMGIQVVGQWKRDEELLGLAQRIMHVMGCQ